MNQGGACALFQSGSQEYSDWKGVGFRVLADKAIPQLGQVTLLARAAGSVYTATLKKNRARLVLNDPNAMTPTVKGFAPQKMTEAQIKALVKMTSGSSVR